MNPTYLEPGDSIVSQQILSVQSSLFKVIDKIDSLELQNAKFSRMLKNLNSSLQRIENRPFLMSNNNTPPYHNTSEQSTNDVNATLCKNPRSLFILWDEYNKGIAGRKPARTFTSSERGQKK